MRKAIHKSNKAPKTSSVKSSLSLINGTFIIILLVLVVYVLRETRDLLLPMIMALILFFVFSILEDYFIQILGRFFSLRAIIKSVLSKVLSVIVIGFFLTQISSIISDNVSSVMKETESYGVKITEKISKVTNKIKAENLKISEAPQSVGFISRQFYPIIKPVADVKFVEIQSRIVGKINFSMILTHITVTLTTITKNMSITLLYLFFLLLERKYFSKKLAILKERNSRLAFLMPIFKLIKRDLIAYLGIKTLSSLVTALLSYAILSYVQVDFASFWAMLIFILNFIPTIGSIIAVIFPILLAFVQFDHPTVALVLAGFLIGVQQFIGNFVEPRYLGVTLNLSPLVILISLGVWGSIWGIIGMFLSVPIMVTINIFLSHFKQTESLAIMLSADGKIKSQKKQ